MLTEAFFHINTENQLLFITQLLNNVPGDANDFDFQCLFCYGTRSVASQHRLRGKARSWGEGFVIKVRKLPIRPLVRMLPSKVGVLGNSTIVGG